MRVQPVWRRARARYVCLACREQIGRGDRYRFAGGLLLCAGCGRDLEELAGRASVVAAASLLPAVVR